MNDVIGKNRTGATARGLIPPTCCVRSLLPPKVIAAPRHQFVMIGPLRIDCRCYLRGVCCCPKYFDTPCCVRLHGSQRHQGQQRDCTLREQKVTHPGHGRTRQSPPFSSEMSAKIRPFTEEPPVARRLIQKYTPFTGWQSLNESSAARGASDP